MNYGGQSRISLPVLHGKTLCLSEGQNIEYDSSFNYSKLEDIFPSKTNSGIKAGKNPFLGPHSNPPYIAFTGEHVGIAWEFIPKLTCLLISTVLFACAHGECHFSWKRVGKMNG